ncbi:MAG: hypothetical protein ACF8Q5_10335 [Phycisphaerales bacterium JB040]
MPPRSRAPVRHHCPHCGYDIAPVHYPDEFQCPECGQIVERGEAYRAAQVHSARLNRRTAAGWIIVPSLLALGILGLGALNHPGPWARVAVRTYVLFVPVAVVVIPGVILWLRARQPEPVRAHLPLNLLGAYVGVAGLAYLAGAGIAWMME